MSRLGRGHPIKAQYQRGVIGLHTEDAATIGLVLTASGSETYTPSVPTTDSATVGVLFTPSGVDEYIVGGVEYTDSATAELLLTASGIDELTTEYIDTGTVVLNIERSRRRASRA